MSIHEDRASFDRFAAAWARLDVAGQGPAGEVIEATAQRLAALRADLRDARAGLDAQARASATAVAAGELSIAQALAAEAAMGALDPRQASRRALDLHDAAAGRVLAGARARLREQGPALHALLSAAHSAIVDSAERLAPRVEGITDDGAAMRSDAKSREAWASLATLSDRRAAVLEVTGDLRRLQVLDDVAEATDTERLFVRPDLAPSPGELARLHPAAALVAVVTSGAGPAVLDVDAVRANVEERERRGVKV